MTGPLLLLDGPNMWFRSYFGVPASIRAPDGRPVNAVRGFVDSVTRLVVDHRPSRLVVCLDVAWRPRWRVDLVKSYKAHRLVDSDGGENIEDVPDELLPQVEMILEVLRAIGIATAGAPDCEADDVLGTLAARERRDPVIVVSGDRDLLQVVTDEPVPVRVLYLGRGLNKAELLGPVEVAAAYGLPIDRAGSAYAEMALLRGDPSDGLPGVAGIGAKTAARLLRQYGTLAKVLGAAADPESTMSERTRARLLSAAEYITAADPVVRVRADAPVALSTPHDVLPTTPNHLGQLAGSATELGIGSAISRLTDALEHR